MTMATAQNQVVTPEAVPLDLEIANIGSRALAVMIDWLIQGTTLFALIIGFTGAPVSGVRLISLNASPLGSTPTRLRTMSSPRRSSAIPYVSGLDIDWIVNGKRESPAS